MKTFVINKSAEIVCSSVKTRYGFRHDAKLYENGWEIGKAKRCYYNRTWESFEYESVIQDLLNKTKYLSEDEKKAFLERTRKGEYEEVEKNFGMIAMVAKIGEIFHEGDKVETNKWKKRMIQAGLGDQLDFPEDWDSLSEEEKEKRLDNVIKEMTNKK